MAWSWSHTQEAYDNAHTNLCNLPDSELRVITAEWKAAKYESEYTEPDLDLAKYEREVKREPDTNLIWDRASEQATCDNGGFNAWVCPWGCHTVPFDPPESA